jgi:hypothetical protein
MAVGSFVDASLLFRQQSGLVRLLRHDPDEFSFLEHLELLASNAFPASIPSFFSFNFDDRLCFCHSFQIKSDAFSIIAITSQFYPELYWHFFKSLIRDFEQSPEPVTPECRFLLISSLLKSWHLTDGNQIFVQSSSDLQYVTLDTKLSCFSYFNPLRVIDSACTPLQLWTHVVSGHPLRVIGRSPEMVAYAVFGLASLTFPFPYRNRIVMAASETDPRILAGGFEGCAIVAYATTRKQADDPRFAETLVAASSGALDPELLQKDLKSRFKGFAKLMERLLAAQLANDPYGDYLKLSFTETAVIRQVPEKEVKKIMSIEMLKEFEVTGTARQWRESKSMIPILRDFFLSISPAQVINTKTPEQLVECEKLVDLLMRHYSLDEHFTAVLQRHRHLIRRRLRAAKR